MIDLIHLLFTRSYWRALFRAHTWATAYLNLRRFHKDRRSRKQFVRFLGFVSIPVLVLAYLGWLLGSGGLFLLPILGLLAWWQRGRKPDDGAALSIQPRGEPVARELSAQEKAGIRGHFADLALFYAVLLNRAGSEGYLKAKVVPEGMEVISRRLHLDLLRSRNVWDRLAPVDRETLMAADGHWESWQIDAALLAGERVRLLRWALRLDSFLPTVGQQLKVDHKSAHAIVDEPGLLYRGTDLIAPEGVDLAYGAAEEYFFRCYAEGLERGYYLPENDEERTWASSLCARLRGQQHLDLLLDAQLVSEASGETIRWAAEMSHQRRIFLSWMARVLDGEAELRAEFPPFLPLQPGPEEAAATA